MNIIIANVSRREDIYIYIYIYIEREREREIYIYIYIYTHNVPLIGFQTFLVWALTWIVHP